ncbi:MAG: ABC transporter permease [Azoarcus sp.]|jgi:putative ABC transport system permease protein|nr:ABC transporter permease [Azoarcus sp.]
MRWRDLLLLALHALVAYRLRSFLTLLGIAVGIAAVIVLTSIGQGLQNYVLNEFAKFGSNIIKIMPGRQEARGGTPVPTTARDLTLDDAAALARLPFVIHVSPAVTGDVEVRANGRTRRTIARGVGPSMHVIYSVEVGSGQFLPEGEGRDARALAVLGATIQKEFFGTASPLGARIEIGGERYRIIGVLQSKGQILDVDIDDAVYIPTARAMALFNRSGADNIKLTYDVAAGADAVLPLIRQTLTSRHGVEDFTLTKQEELISSLLDILHVLTLTVAALGGISLAVGAVGIVTIMTIAVAERTSEIGLLVALGARRRTILGLFLTEAVALAALGGLLGLIVGIILGQVAGAFMPPEFPVSTSWKFALAAEVLSALIGLAAGVLPAQRAARLNVIDALHTE